MKNLVLLLVLILGFGPLACKSQDSETTTSKKSNMKEISMATEDDKTEKVRKTEEEWKKELTSQEYRILRQKGTEIPYTNEFYKHEEEGTYVCAACGNKLFNSETKYHSGSGWPSYYAPISSEVISTQEDNSLFMTRTEVLCSRCDSHLGHVFNDGPNPTGLRYCINSAALDFEKEENSDE